MATFPALEPDERSYDFGRYPLSTQTGWAGGVVRFRHGTTPANHRLRLGFRNLSAAEAKLIRDHYRGQRGGFFSFFLSPEAWAGHASQVDLVPSSTTWRYTDQPEETHKSGGLVDITVELEAVV